jgi:hypothetical protein
MATTSLDVKSVRYLISLIQPDSDEGPVLGRIFLVKAFSLKTNSLLRRIDGGIRNFPALSLLK